MTTLVSIVVDLKGGFGNQIFQIAAALAVKRVLKKEAPISTEPVYVYLVRAKTNKHNKLGYDYTRFCTEEEDQEVVAVDHRDEVGAYDEEVLINYGFQPWDPQTVYQSVINCFSAEGEKKSKKVQVYVDGYFQYLGAIKEVIPEIQRAILKKLPISAVREAYGLVDTPEMDEKRAFVHVRRGDYCNHPDFHYLQNAEYYVPALQTLYKENPGVKDIIILSDDPEWCKTQSFFQEENNGERNMFLVRDADEMRCFAIMTTCKGGAVICNSTFSWWGALFSETPVVFYPPRWIGMQIHDLFPPFWTKVEPVQEVMIPIVLKKKKEDRRWKEKTMCIVFVCEDGEEYNAFKNACSHLRNEGQYDGDIVVMTFEEECKPEDQMFMEKNEVHSVRFPEFHLPSSIQKLREGMKEVETDPKKCGWNKLSLFSTYFRQWESVAYMDCRIKIHGEVSPVLELCRPHKLMAHRDAFPTFEWRLRKEFDMDYFSNKTVEPSILSLLETRNYFQIPFLLFDTSVIKDDTMVKLYKTLLEYPNTKTVQGILNLYFLSREDSYNPLPIQSMSGNYYFYDNFRRFPNKPYLITAN